MPIENNNVFKKGNFHATVILIFLLLQPMIDLLTSFNLYYFPTCLTIGIIVRTAFMAYVVLLVISNKSQGMYRKYTLFYLAIIFVFSVFYLFINLYFKGAGSLALEVKGLIKSFYFPIVLISLFFVVKNTGLIISSKLLCCIMTGYTFVIFFATITGTYLYTYDFDKLGSKGWFYAANEIGTIIAILLPYVFLFVLKLDLKSKKRHVVFGLSALGFLIFSVLFIATKVPLFSAIGYLLGFVFLYFVYFFFKKDKKYLFNAVFLVFVFLICGSIFSYTPSNKTIGASFIKIYDIIQKNEQPPLNSSSDTEDSDDDDVTTVILSNRNNAVATQRANLLDSPIIQKAMGMGTSYRDSTGDYVEITVEQDHWDILFHYGILGTIVYLASFVGFLILLFGKFLLNIKNAFFSQEICTGLFSLILAIGVAMISGHTFVAPAVSIFIVLDIIFLYQQSTGMEMKLSRNSKESSPHE